ncbi:hypothetical protein DEH84_06805 [Aquabacterium olei]|uniref:Uncharacterized protein n=1 Tax=Aquabacterium olei TaxID=1296669 RepID=A0A2U8FQ76_9BURK|nr:hypothetical protein [Aquabacterium olei]AWI53169.1 hypothetical protein DEH84_06805 [Aquabacterium olei]
MPADTKTIDKMDTFGRIRPVCPACAYQLTTLDMMRPPKQTDDAPTRAALADLAQTEGRTTIRCPRCAVTYHCRGHFIPQYTTALDESDL